MDGVCTPHEEMNIQSNKSCLKSWREESTQETWE
jgi:hypothetical protein